MDEPIPGTPPQNDSAATPIRTTLTFDPRDLIPTPIFCAAPDGRMVWMNAAAEDLTGRSTTGLPGTSFAEFFPAHLRSHIARAFVRHHRRKNRDFYIEAPVVDKGGAPHWVGMHVRMVSSTNGRSAYLCSAHDLQSIHCELEDHRRREKELEARLGEATAGAELKSAFLASMSHELRAPMNGVIGMSRLLLDSNLDRDQRTFAEVIRSSGEQLLELVDDILDYSRIESGQLEIGRMDFDVRVTVDAVSSLLAGRAHELGVAFSSWVHHRVPSRLTGDPGRVRQVLLDVCQQALKAAPGGDMSLQVELFEETAHQVIVRFQVNREFGQAPEDEADALCAVFEDSGADGAPGANGARALGLTIDRKIVRLMGGDTGAVSAPGTGARLWFRVPFGKQAEPVAPAETSSPAVAVSGLRVLVVDPEPTARQILTRTLAGWGALCDGSADGIDALERLKNGAASGRPYSLAIVNIDVPELDAGTLGCAVREDAPLANTGLVLVTDTGRPGDAARATEWGYDAYFVNPIEDDVLRQVLDHLAARSESDERVLVTRFTLMEQRRSRLRILLVEDNPIDQLVALSALKRVGYSAEAVATAADAAAAAARQGFDMVFVDLSLAGFETGEAMSRLRSGDGSSERTPIVGLIGRMRDDERVHWQSLGVDDFLPKPIDLELLCETAERWARESAQASAPDDAPDDAPDETPAEAPVASATPAPVETPAPAAAPEPAAAPAAEPAAEPAWPAADAAPAAGPNEESSAGPNEGPGAPPTPPEVTEAWVAQDEFEHVPLVDASKIESSTMGNPELRSMLVEAFLSRTQQPLDRLRRAHEVGDRKQMEIQAHALHGLCTAVGAARAAALFDRIRHHCSNEPRASLDAWVNRAASAIHEAMSTVHGAHGAHGPQGSGPTQESQAA